MAKIKPTSSLMSLMDWIMKVGHSRLSDPSDDCHVYENFSCCQVDNKILTNMRKDHASIMMLVYRIMILYVITNATPATLSQEKTG